LASFPASSDGSQKELFRVPVSAGPMRNAGYIEMDRQNHDKAMKAWRSPPRKSVKAIGHELSRRDRSRDGRIKSFNKACSIGPPAGFPSFPSLSRARDHAQALSLGSIPARSPW
jgi:hypothetical protein